MSHVSSSLQVNSGCTDRHTDGCAMLLPLLYRLLEVLLSASTVLCGATPTDELAGKYLGSVQRKAREVVGKVASLLSLGSFLDMVGQLIAGSSPLVQHQALGLLTQELRSAREAFGSEHVRRVNVDAVTACS